MKICVEKTKINEEEARDGPFLNIAYSKSSTANIPGEYAMLEHENVKGVVESLKIMTEWNTERLCRFAFDHARKHGRQKVTLVHKAVSYFSPKQVPDNRLIWMLARTPNVLNLKLLLPPG